MKNELFQIIEDVWNRNSIQQKSDTHIRRQGKWLDDIRWKKVGEDNVERYKQLCLLSNHCLQIESMVEWGVGGGANAVAFSRYAKRFYGVDIVPNVLDECAKQLRLQDYASFEKILIKVATPESALSQIILPVDFFLSVSVYMHFPCAEYGIKISKLAYQMLSDDGIALIQTRYLNEGTSIYKDLLLEDEDFTFEFYEEHRLHFTVYDIDVFWLHLEDIGFKVIGVILDPHITYAYYLIKK